MKPITAAAMRDAVRPVVEKFTRSLATAMARSIDDVRSRALATARDSIERELAGEPKTPVPSRRPKRKPTKTPTPPSPTPTVAKTKPRTRRPMKCSKCGAEGFRADGCGRTHNTGAAVDASDSDDEEPPRARRGRAPLEANHLEERVIPHAVLVARLVAARADDLGDAGGYVARADREPSLIGHTEEKRELCPAHGWVGRVAFEREHFACLPVGEMCERCNGRGRMTTGSFICKHCNGTGIEPPQVVASIVPPALPDVESEGPRHRRRADLGMGSRAETTAAKRILRRDLAVDAEALAPELAELDSLRPKTRADCVDAQRPCPWVSCRHHLAIDINPETGSIKINFPDLEPWELEDTCALDVAERGGVTLEEAGLALNVTRERLRQIEVIGLHKLKATRIVQHGIGPGDFADQGEHPLAEVEES